MSGFAGAGADWRFIAKVGRDAPDLGRHIECLVAPSWVRGGLSRKIAATRMRFPDVHVVHGIDTDQPLNSRCPTVCTVHDLALFDVPWAFAAGRAIAKRRLVAASIRSADELIAVSQFTADRVRARFGRTCSVIHEAAGREFAPAQDTEVRAIRMKYALPDQFVLYLGNHEPRKDIASLAQACSLASIPLVVGGGAIIFGSAIPNVRTLGYIPAEDLAALYGAATVVGYVARYEGFGLPPVEAMASGACVMATRVGALPDIAREGIEFVPQGSPHAQAAALRRLLNDGALREHRRDHALQEAAMLTWRKTADATMAVYRSLL